MPARMVLLVTLLGVSVVLAGCCAPSECPQAQEGFAKAQPFIDALEQYRQDHGAYPERLMDLAPIYLLPNTISSARKSFVDGYALVYRLTDESYRLTFRYTGPGMNQCDYTPEEGWQCSGYY